MKQFRKLSTFLFTLFIPLGFMAYREFLGLNIFAYTGQFNIWNSRRFIFFLAFCVLSIALLTLAVYSTWKDFPIFSSLKKIRRLSPLLKQISAGFFTILPALAKWFPFLPDTIDLGFWTSIFLMYCAALVAAWLTGDEDLQPSTRLLKVSSYWLAGGAAYAICAKLVFITDYPFPLYWSEGNRFFDYSTLMGAFRYNFPQGTAIYAFTNWGMQLPWALPFVLPNLSISAFRFWYQLMWILPAFLFGITAYKTFSREKAFGINSITFGLWTFVFLDQGPIYAPLLIAGIVTMLGLRFRLVPAALAVMLASFYAYESRWTWSFAPGLWAGLTALLIINNLSFSREKFIKLFRPVLLGLAGLFGGSILPKTVHLFNAINARLDSSIAAAGSQSISTDVHPGIISPTVNQLFVFVDVIPDIIPTATRQPLLWERLLPNSTYPPGILLGIAWAASPLIVLLIVLAIKKIWQPNWLQSAAVWVVSAGFFAVGLTASVKIGGGSNLHNLDMFLVTLVIIASAALANFWPHGSETPSAGFWVSTLVALVMVFPITYALRTTEKPQLPDTAAIEDSLAVIRGKIAETPPNEEILFIDHRQLLTFNLVPQVPLVDEYEKKKLMDEAMSADASYFEPFYEDIRNKRFALIINEPLNLIIRGEDHSFGDENDAYVRWVTLPLTCSYEAIYTNYATGVELLVPRIELPQEYVLPCQKFTKSP